MDHAPASLLIISKKALNKKHVNWILNDDPIDEHDSGWQLFSGDESEDYLDDPANSVLITLDDAIVMQPELAAVFNADPRAEAYEWDKETQAFVEAEYDVEDDETEADWEER